MMSAYDAQRPPGASAEPMEQTAASAPVRGKVLVVDDDPLNLRMLQRLLERMGFSVQTSLDGVEALEIVDADCPDIIFLDVMLPGMDGVEIGRRIRAMPNAERVPIIFLTALSDADTLMSCVEAGGDDFLTKPVSFELLKARIMVTERVRDLQRTMLASSQPLAELLEREQEEQQLAERVFSRVIRTRNIESDRLRVEERSAAVFSGDLILSQRLPDGGIRVLIADITGHGLAATIGALPVAEAFHAMTQKGVADREVLEEINRKLYTVLPSDRFMAASMVSVDGSGRSLSWWNGGMPSGWLRARDGLKELASHALPLGVLPELSPGDAPRILGVDEGDAVVLLTDGLLQAPNAHGEEFGLTRLRACLGQWGFGESVSPRLLNVWEAHCGEIPPTDEVALLELAVAPAQQQLPAPKRGDPRRSAWSWSVELEPRRLSALGGLGSLLMPLSLTGGLETQLPRLDRILSTLCRFKLAAMSEGASSTRYRLEIRFDPQPIGGQVRIELTEAGGDCGQARVGSGAPHMVREGPPGDLPAELRALGGLCESLIYDEQGRVSGALCSW